METSDKVQPADFYRLIESWWDAPFDDDLIDRMIKAPWEHLEVFAESAEDLVVSLESTAKQMPTGYLRPAIVENHGMDNTVRVDALRLLLYAHEVVLDRSDLFPDFYSLNNPGFLESSLKQIKAMRPFVEDGSIKITPIKSIGRHPSLRGEYERVMTQADEILMQVEEERAKLDSIGLEIWDELSRKNWSELSEENKRLNIYISRYSQISAACRLAANHRAHTLARSRLDEEVIRAMLQRPMTDVRQVNLQKLAALHVPTITGIDNVVALRKSSEDFAEWRNRLGEALTYVGELGEDDESVDEAAEVVYAQLSDGLSHVQKAVKKSPALRAARGGLTGFAISGISAMTTELLLSDQSVGLVAAASAAGAGAGMVVDSGVSYLKALQERRKGKLIMDVSMLFDPDGSMPEQLARSSEPLQLG